jgi:hypothetical protein
MAYSVWLIPGLDYTQSRRGVAFLESNDNASVNAKKVFGSLNEKHRREMLSRFDYWQRGGIQDKYFHGFNQPYRNCFVFKRKDAGTYYRYYGFIMNPRILTDPRYQVCILISHVVKNTEQTDLSELNAAIGFRNNQEVVKAVKAAFPELIKG